MAQGRNKKSAASDDDGINLGFSLSPGRENLKKIEKMDNIKESRQADPVLSRIKFMERADLGRVVNGAYIAERFFGKSGSWFSQKLNRNMKNGKPCEFTPSERETLSLALHTIAIELQDLADDLQ